PGTQESRPNSAWVKFLTDGANISKFNWLCSAMIQNFVLKTRSPFLHHIAIWGKFDQDGKEIGFLTTVIFFDCVRSVGFIYG
ncbi:MAG: hypothetical protein AAF570_05215, partial [Bacteroidota bacterium]